MIIITKDFTLRPYKKTDAESLQKNINNIKVSRYTSNIPHPYSMKAAHEWILENLKEQQKKNSDILNLVIDKDNEVAGCVGLSHIIPGHKAELGYWLAEKFWGQGIMTKSVKLACQYAFGQYDLRRIHAFVFLPNKGSKRVLEKSGFKQEGILKKYGMKNNRYFNAYLFAKIK